MAYQNEEKKTGLGETALQSVSWGAVGAWTR